MWWANSASLYLYSNNSVGKALLLVLYKALEVYGAHLIIDLRGTRCSLHVVATMLSILG